MPHSTPTNVKLAKITEQLLQGLDARSRDIVSRRFGIKNGRTETLESIGKHYGITRERVRQIESQTKRVLASRQEDLQAVATIFDTIFKENGGILAEDHAVELVRAAFATEELYASLVAFYLEILPAYTYIARDSHFAPHWRDKSLVKASAVKVVDQARTILKKAEHPLSQEQLMTAVLQSLHETPQTLATAHIYAQLRASKFINLTPFKEWGLIEWSETNPRGVGDKAYSVLRRHNKPEHFTRITEMINEAAFDHKRANAQTVHNELIKDGRFVLVGRGLYGLAEWGYIPGTVADVLESLLVKAAQPLTREELIEQVLAQRQVKKNTILLGLQNERRFVKTSQNRYTLKGQS